MGRFSIRGFGEEGTVETMVLLGILSPFSSIASWGVAEMSVVWNRISTPRFLRIFSA